MAIGFASVGVAVALALPGVRLYWSIRSSNPVRRGIALARNLGCFSCHGELGSAGIADPGAADLAVPAWSGGLWMMYVEDDDDIREFIVDGVSHHRSASGSAAREHDRMAIHMPAYGGLLGAEEVGDLVAAFRVLSGMSRPAPGSAEARGLQIALASDCFSCHGAGASGGLPNPGSLTGFVPGWYGADFEDLVRDRDEFDQWVREGALVRLSEHPVASRFINRQRLQMPPYRELSDDDLDTLWAYAGWLARTAGGVQSTAALGEDWERPRGAIVERRD